MKKLYLILAILFFSVVVRNVFATPEPKVDWCHCAASGVCNTLNLSMNALINAGHVSAGGQPLHSGDHAGACVVPSPTVAPTATPTVEPSVSPTVTPSPTPTVTVTPTPTETPKPTDTPKETPREQSSFVSTTGTPSNSCAIEVGVAGAVNVETGVPNDNAIEVYWSAIRSADKINLYYSEENGNWRYSVIGADNTGHFQIGGLVNGQHYWVAVQGTAGSCSGNLSSSVDPLP